MEDQLNAEVSNEVNNEPQDQFVGLKFNKDSFAALIEIVRSQADRIAALESKNQTSSTKREMTIADAERVTFGDMREKTHNECATELGLSYGQIYSARLGHTFKPTTKEMLARDLPMIWVKKAK